MNNTFGQSELWLTDLANLSDARGMCRQILQQHESLDAVVNNAGVLQKNPEYKHQRIVTFALR